MKKRIKGKIYFYLKDGQLKYDIVDYANKDSLYVKLHGGNEFEVYCLMEGKEFTDDVECGGFIDYDGSIAGIYVDGYKSNLGIWDKGIHQGQFCLGLEDFRKLCERFKVEVNWANK